MRISENSSMSPGQSFSLEISSVIEDLHSEFQHIQIYQTKTYGKCLVLDGMIQCTERDEFAYQEMISHLALFSHPCPKNILVIGGGDGGVVREVLKHLTVESVTLCEIDPQVVALSKKHLSFMSSGLEDPRCNIHYRDGTAYLESHCDSFDVIITDSSDPIGPAETLFQEAYYHKLNKALRKDGLLISQCECVWLHLDLISKMLDFTRRIFPSVSYAYTTIPSYPSGQIGFIICSKQINHKLNNPVKNLSSQDLDNLNLRYYSTEIHRASFVLPRFVTKALNIE